MLDAGERLSRLEVLDLNCCGINDLHCDLAFNYSLPALVELDLSSNSITDNGVSNLLATGWQRQLKLLVLGRNRITDFGARLLAERWPTDSPLENLNLEFTNIGAEGQRLLLARFGEKIDLI
jgi:Ran GTPase-activating protein (RanGAP) involved in mRNA processing and transport